jgi:phage tail-like protein
MPRSLADDFYQAYRFAVAVAPAADAFILEANAGFNNITIPEVSLEAAEYREGTYVYTRKQPGIPTYSDVTMQQGVSSIGGGGAGTPFFDWILAAIEGREYRADLAVWHLHRADAIDAAASRIINLRQAWPMRVKPDGDLDATSSEISLRELDVAIESMDFDVVIPG